MTARCGCGRPATAERKDGEMFCARCLEEWLEWVEMRLVPDLKVRSLQVGGGWR
jgi:hypothetical protein